jgi:hypothetical protein
MGQQTVKAEPGVVIIRSPRGRLLNKQEAHEHCRYEAIGNGWSKRLSVRMMKRLANPKALPWLYAFGLYEGLAIDGKLTPRGRAVVNAWKRFKRQ